MPLYVQNGNLLNKAGTLGTSAGCCCYPPPPPPPQCCCDETGIRALQPEEECTGSQFSMPDPTPSISVVFEWCGLIAEDVIQGGVNSYYDTENVDFYVCDTTGRYEEGVASYTQALNKTISVYVFPGSQGGLCGYRGRFYVSAVFQGVGFKDQGGGSFFAFEAITTIELYDFNLSVCYDGSKPDISIDMFDFSRDDTCGGTGCFAPCKYITPELTVLGAP